eukprot:3946338-Alexandrium_andersonii.AAC.2
MVKRSAATANALRWSTRPGVLFANWMMSFALLHVVWDSASTSPAPASPSPPSSSSSAPPN